MAEMRENKREICRKKMPYNYQLWLVTCLLQLNDLADADLLISTLWGERKLDLTIHRDLLCTLFEILEVAIKKLHPGSIQGAGGQNVKTTSWFRGRKAKEDTRTLRWTGDGQDKGIKVCENPQELLTHLPKILKLIGVYVGQNYAIYSKLLQTVHYHLIEGTQDSAYHA